MCDHSLVDRWRAHSSAQSVSAAIRDPHHVSFDEAEDDLRHAPSKKEGELEYRCC